MPELLAGAPEGPAAGQLAERPGDREEVEVRLVEDQVAAEPAEAAGPDAEHEPAGRGLVDVGDDVGIRPVRERLLTVGADVVHVVVGQARAGARGPSPAGRVRGRPAGRGPAGGRASPGRPAAGPGRDGVGRRGERPAEPPNGHRPLGPGRRGAGPGPGGRGRAGGSGGGTSSGGSGGRVAGRRGVGVGALHPGQVHAVGVEQDVLAERLVAGPLVDDLDVDRLAHLRVLRRSTRCCPAAVLNVSIRFRSSTSPGRRPAIRASRRTTLSLVRALPRTMIWPRMYGLALLDPVDDVDAARARR